MSTNSESAKDVLIVHQILPFVDDVMNISQRITDLGEQFADKMDKDVNDKKLTVREANVHIKKMIVIQNKFQKIEEFCYGIQNLYRIRALLQKKLHQLEENKKFTEIEKVAGIHNRIERARERGLRDRIGQLEAPPRIIYQLVDQPLKKEKKRRSRSLVKAVKNVVKEVRRSLSRHKIGEDHAHSFNSARTF